VLLLATIFLLSPIGVLLRTAASSRGTRISPTAISTPTSTR